MPKEKKPKETPEQRSEHARKAAKAKHAKLPLDSLVAILSTDAKKLRQTIERIAKATDQPYSEAAKAAIYLIAEEIGVTIRVNEQTSRK